MIGARRLTNLAFGELDLKERLRRFEMVQTYKPGETVPQSGTVQCVGHSDVRDDVTAGTRFAPCHHIGDQDSGSGCVWQYV